MSEFSKRVEDLLQTVESGSLPTAYPPTKGEATHAGVSFDGVLTTRPSTEPVGDWDNELRSWGYDPARYEVVEPIRVSTWEAQTKTGVQQMWAYRAQIRSRSGLSDTEINALTDPVRRVRRKSAKPASGDCTLVMVIGDWQIGKDDGDGLEGTVARIEATFDALLNRVTILRKAGYNVNHLFIASVGDLGEGCNGHYEQQTFSVVLDRRDQNKVIRRLARNLLMAVAPSFEQVTVAAVGGNHGENRKGSKSFTSTNDNDDVAIWEAVAEALSVRPDLYGHIKWLLPRNELSVSLEVQNHIVGLAHGHQAKSGDIGRWWQGQALGNLNVGNADILLTGHFHHLRCVEVAKGRWHFQCPAMDGGSDWFSEATGRGSTAGQMCFVLTDGGWAELAVL
jgi:predicted phosphodiesterase